MKKTFKCMAINKNVNGTASVVLHELAPDSTEAKPVVLSVLTLTFKDSKEADNYQHFAMYTVETARVQ